jgi:hypothetical protein
MLTQVEALGLELLEVRRLPASDPRREATGHLTSAHPRGLPPQDGASR